MFIHYGCIKHFRSINQFLMRYIIILYKCFIHYVCIKHFRRINMLIRYIIIDNAELFYATFIQ